MLGMDSAIVPLGFGVNTAGYAMLGLGMQPAAQARGNYLGIEAVSSLINSPSSQQGCSSSKIEPSVITSFGLSGIRQEHASPTILASHRLGYHNRFSTVHCTRSTMVRHRKQSHQRPCWQHHC